MDVCAVCWSRHYSHTSQTTNPIMFRIIYIVTNVSLFLLLFDTFYMFHFSIGTNTFDHI